MKIKLIQLINNYYKDEEQGEKTKDNIALGTYCAFGYFDALQIEEPDEDDDSVQNSMWKIVNEVTAKYLDGTCNRRNLGCFSKEREKDENFWNKAKEYPYLFLSMVRVKRQEDDNLERIHDAIAEINGDDCSICYYPYDHSEVIVLRLERNYQTGMQYVLNLGKKFKTLKMYSIFSVKEETLETEAKISESVDDEMVDIRLRAIIKSEKEAYHFLEKLAKKNEMKMEIYDTLGSEDMVVEMRNISIRKWLSEYKMGNMMTHTNKEFGKAFYNIETEIIKYKKEIDGRMQK